MTIIKNLIARNKLKKQLEALEISLRETGYYESQAKLSTLVYNPDAYAELYTKINKKYNVMITKKHTLEKQLYKLSGKNLFKKQEDIFNK